MSQIETNAPVKTGQENIGNSDAQAKAAVTQSAQSPVDARINLIELNCFVDVLCKVSRFGNTSVKNETATSISFASLHCLKMQLDATSLVDEGEKKRKASVLLKPQSFRGKETSFFPCFSQRFC